MYALEELAHDRYQSHLARLASLPPMVIEAWVASFPPHYAQRRPIPRWAHGGPTTPDRPLTAPVATVVRPRGESHPRGQRLAVPWIPCGPKGHLRGRGPESHPPVYCGTVQPGDRGSHGSSAVPGTPHPACDRRVKPVDRLPGGRTDAGTYALIPPTTLLHPRCDQLSRLTP